MVPADFKHTSYLALGSSRPYAVALRQNNIITTAIFLKVFQFFMASQTTSCAMPLSSTSVGWNLGCVLPTQREELVSLAGGGTASQDCGLESKPVRSVLSLIVVSRLKYFLNHTKVLSRRASCEWTVKWCKQSRGWCWSLCSCPLLVTCMYQLWILPFGLN